MPARGVGRGDGWGGPARGAHISTPYGPFSADHQPPPPDPAERAERRRLAAEKQARIDQLIENLGDLALNAEREETRVSATVAALNRLDGLPVATNKNLNAEVTLEDLVKQAAGLREKPP